MILLQCSVQIYSPARSATHARPLFISLYHNSCAAISSGIDLVRVECYNESDQHVMISVENFMGVRFPHQFQRSDFAQMRQAVPLQQRAVQEETQQSNRPSNDGTTITERGIQEPREPNRPEQESTVGRAARAFGAQTPGSIIDLFA